ncbi:hypothetical protein VPH35_069581 [Triticum aestivum]
MIRKHFLNPSLTTHTGCTEEYKDVFIGPVHVEDVALAHITLFENPAASGRHLCVEPICHLSDFASQVPELYADYEVPNAEELMALGLHFTPLEKNIKDAVESLRRRGCIA